MRPGTDRVTQIERSFESRTCGGQLAVPRLLHLAKFLKEAEVEDMYLCMHGPSCCRALRGFATENRLGDDGLPHDVQMVQAHAAGGVTVHPTQD